MWTSAELKTNARAVLRGNYGSSLVMLLLFGIIYCVGFGVAYIVPFGTIALPIFVGLPLTVGIYFFYMQMQVAPVRLQNLFYTFNGGRYLKIVGAMAWMYLFLMLWMLIPMSGLFILLFKWISVVITASFDKETLRYALENYVFDSSWLPAFIATGVIYVAGFIIVCIKSLSYSMTGYVLTDNPYIGYNRALRLSIDMTRGQKWHMFVMYLSFIGWYLLALVPVIIMAALIPLLGLSSDAVYFPVIIIVCMIPAYLAQFFLAPYIQATQAQLYVRLRDNAIHTGLTSPQELNVTPV